MPKALQVNAEHLWQRKHLWILHSVAQFAASFTTKTHWNQYSHTFQTINQQQTCTCCHPSVRQRWKKLQGNRASQLSDPKTNSSTIPTSIPSSLALRRKHLSKRLNYHQLSGCLGAASADGLGSEWAATSLGTSQPGKRPYEDRRF